MKKSCFFIFLIFFGCSVSYGSISPSKLSISDKEINKSEFLFQKQLNRLSIITPIAKPNFSKANSGVLSYLNESDLIKRFNNKSAFSLANISVRSDNAHWKRKYFALLNKLTSQVKHESIDVYKTPTEYNLVIVVYDIVPPSKNYHSYCNVYLNKRKFGQTNQALLSQKKIVKLKVKTDVQHMLKVEKLFLNEKKNEWEKMRSITQPKRKYFIIPKGRIRVITIVYDSYKEKPDTAHLKYKFLTHFMKKNEKI